MADLLKFNPGIRAKRILLKYSSTVPNAVKASLVEFNNRLLEERLVSREVYDPGNIIFSSLQSATTLYQACINTVENNPSKFPTLMDVLGEYPLLDGDVKEMTAAAVQAKVMAPRSESVPQEGPHGGARQRQRGLAQAAPEPILGTADGQPTAGQRIQPTPHDHEQKTASQPPREQPSTTHGASSGQQMQAPSTPEKSPSPAASKGALQTEALDTSDLFAVLMILQDLSKWQLLGLALGMDFPSLNDIKKSQGDDAENCKMAMLHAWLETGKATKSSLVAALKKMGENSIADKLIQ